MNKVRENFILDNGSGYSDGSCSGSGSGDL